MGSLLLLLAAAALSVGSGRAAPPTAPASLSVTVPATNFASGAALGQTVAWCGSGETAENRSPQSDPLAQSAIRVFYAYPADVPDRFPTLADAIVSDVAAIDAWWQGQDATRRLRWDLYPFPGCSGGAASLDLGVVPLSRPSASYATNSGFERVSAEIAAHLGSAEKALVFFDGLVIDPRICGVSDQAPRNGGPYGMSIVALRSSCWVDVGAGDGTARVAIHELVHNLGAVPSKAPNRCGDASLGGHVCDGARDLMFPYVSAAMRLDNAILDVDRNDYYGHSGDWWDVQDSAWLVHLPLRSLLVTVSGTGSVTSSPSLVSCPGTCAAMVESDLAITLTAAAASGAEFYGWKGACSGDGTCRQSMTRDVSVLATFGPPRPTLTVRVVGRGRVTSAPAGLRCPGTCAAKYPSGTDVSLAAKPAKGWRFSRWSSPYGSRSGCGVALTVDRTVSATFVRAPR